MVKKTHAIFVLDRSGSMSFCKEATIEGFNSQLRALTNGGQRVWATCLQFDSERKVNLDVLYERMRVGEAPLLTLETYVPRGGTPMLDAVGKAIAIGDRETRADSVLVIVVSDGQENTSQTETWPSIALKIKTRTELGNWTFVYIGANQDLSVVSKRMNIPMGNMMAYASNPIGTQVMYARASGQTVSFTGSVQAATDSFFGGGAPVPPDDDDGLQAAPVLA